LRTSNDREYQYQYQGGGRRELNVTNILFDDNTKTRKTSHVTSSITLRNVVLEPCSLSDRTKMTKFFECDENFVRRINHLQAVLLVKNDEICQGDG